MDKGKGEREREGKLRTRIDHPADMTDASKHRNDSLQQGDLLGNSRVCFVNGLVMVQEGSFVSHTHLVYYCKGKNRKPRAVRIPSHPLSAIRTN